MMMIPQTTQVITLDMETHI